MRKCPDIGFQIQVRIFIKRDSDLSTKNVELLYSAFESEYEKGTDMSLNASDVCRIDTTIFQIIAALKLKSEHMD